MRALALEPGQRYGSVDEMAHALASARRVRAYPRAGLALLAVGTIAAMACLALRPGERTSASNSPRAAVESSVSARPLSTATDEPEVPVQASPVSPAPYDAGAAPRDSE